MADIILKAEKISKSFGGRRLFHDVSLELNSGTINSLFGGNGSGKTTFFNLLGGYDEPDSGRITFQGTTVRPNRESDIARAGLGKMWQVPAVFPNHTLLQNMLVSAKNHPGESLLRYLFQPRLIRRTENLLLGQARQILSRLGLQEKSNRLVGDTSLGDRKLLCIGMLMMNHSSLLLLDEPFSGIDPETINRISSVLEQLRAEGKTIFMIEHKTTIAKEISDHIFGIEKHQILQLI